MSILGNDFLPSSLGLKMRDDGHSELLQILDKLIEKEVSIVNINNQDLQLSKDGLFTLFTLLSIEESSRISYYIYKKMMQAKGLGLLDNNMDIEIGNNNWPLDNIQEVCLKTDKKELIQGWESIYIEKWFPGFDNTPYNIHKICEDYLYTIQWTWNYYIGKMESVCYNWYYPHRLPPLWKWLSAYLEKNGLCSFPNKVLIQAKDIQPLEQLCIVLPLESWNLIPACKEKHLPNITPQYFPSDFGFDPIGKRFFWECEAEIPLISICEIKALFS